MEQTTDLCPLDKGRRLARRYMAWLSFVAMLALGGATWLGVMLGSDIFAANLAAASPILLGLLWALAAIVGAYLGVSLTEALGRARSGE